MDIGFCPQVVADSSSSEISDALQKVDLAGCNDQKLFVKIFCADGSTKSVLVHRMMSTSELLEILVEKNHVQLQPSWGIVEHLPELYMER